MTIILGLMVLALLAYDAYRHRPVSGQTLLKQNNVIARLQVDQAIQRAEQRMTAAVRSQRISDQAREDKVGHLP